MKTEIEALHLIGGERYPSVDDCWAESLDPSSGDRIGRFADGGEREAQAAIEAARRAFRDPVWSHNPVSGSKSSWNGPLALKKMGKLWLNC